MFPMQTFSVVVCRLVLAVSATLTTTYADQPTVQKSGDWTVTIQPGVRGSVTADRGSPTGLPLIRSVSLQAESKPEATPTADLPQIVPAPPAPAGTVTAAPDANATRTVDPLSLVHLYPQVYDAIPFSRAEYAANPSYRHDSTMEFLFGQMRSTVIHRYQGGGRRGGGYYGGGGGYGMPYSQFGFNSFVFPFYYFPDRFMGPYVPYNLW